MNSADGFFLGFGFDMLLAVVINVAFPEDNP